MRDYSKALTMLLLGPLCMKFHTEETQRWSLAIVDGYESAPHQALASDMGQNGTKMNGVPRDIRTTRMRQNLHIKTLMSCLNLGTPT